MLDHVILPVADFDRTRDFYDVALAPLGMRRLYADGEQTASYGRDGRAFFWIYEQTGVPGGAHVAFAADDRAAVADFHAAVLRRGGRDNGAPGPRPQYGPAYFAAFVLDPDGSNVEAVCRRAPG